MTDLVRRAVQKDFTRLGLGILPSILCPRGYRGRLTFFTRFKNYYQEQGHEKASRMIQTRQEVLQQYGLCEDDIAHFDINVCLGLLINTVPATFWTLYYVYSQPILLEEVRSAIHPHIQSLAESSERYVNVAEVAASCPLITSIVHETLRIQSVSTSARKVLEDTHVDRECLLRQGSTVLIPSAEVHTASSVWGASSTEFDARRFCPNKIFENKKPASGYRAFGGGSFLCPGRFLAANEMVIILVMMVLKYDLTPIENHSWPWPEGQSILATAILVPKHDIPVTIQERKGYESEGGSWKFEWRSQDTDSEL